MVLGGFQTVTAREGRWRKSCHCGDGSVVLLVHVRSPEGRQLRSEPGVSSTFRDCLPYERTIPARQTPFLRASQPPKQAPEAGNWAFRIPCGDSSDLKLILFSFLCIYILLCICVLFGHVVHVHMCVSTHVNCMCILYMWVSQRST